MAKTIEDLGKLKRQEYPGEYDDLTDEELGYEIRKANPGKYDNYRDMPKEGEPIPRSTMSKVSKGAERAFQVAGDPTARLLAKGVRQLPVSQEQSARLKQLEQKGDVAYGSEVLEAIEPRLFSPQPTDDVEIPVGPFGMKLPIGAGKTALRIAADIALDPLTYTGFGATTKLGRVVKIAKEARQARQPIKLSGKLAKEIAGVMGASKPSPKVMQDFIKQHVGKLGTPAKTLSQQVSAGERSLVNIGGLHATGKIPGAIVKPLSLARRTATVAKVEGAVRSLLSNKSGNPDFDLLLERYKDLVFYRIGEKLGEAKKINADIEAIVKATGKPREVVNREIRTIVESLKGPIGKKAAQARYSKTVSQAMFHSYNNALVDAKFNLAKAQQAGNAAAVDTYAKQVADIQSQINIHTGTYKPPSDPMLDPIANELKQKAHSQLMDEIASGVDVRPQMADIEYLKHAQMPQARDAMAQHAIKEGKLAPKLTERDLSTHLASAIRRQFAEVKPLVIDAWQEAGLVSKREAKALKGKHGLEHMDTLIDSGRINADQFTDAVHTMTIEEVNALGRAGKLKSIFGDNFKGDVFHTDPAMATGIRGMQGEKARTFAEFFTEMKARKLALPEGAAPPAWHKVSHPDLEGHRVAPEIAKVINRMNEFNLQPQALKKVLQGFDKYNRWAKVWTLAPFPAYHTLNAVGNFWNNWLSGLNNPDMYRQAMQVQLGKGKVNFHDVFGNKWDIPKLREAMKRLGVTDRGFFTSEHEHTIEQFFKSGNYKDLLPTSIKNVSGYITPTTRNYFLRAGLKLGKITENNARAAHFINRLRAGDTAEQAALSVKKYLFDYGDLSSFEKTYLNRGFWFYTWTRKNIPLQLQTLVTEPWRMGAPFKAVNEVEKDTPAGNEKHMADWMQANFPARVKYNEKTGEYTYFMLGRWLPAADLLKISHLHDIAANMVHPIAKVPLEMLFNWNTYMKGPIESYPGEKVKFLGKERPAKLVHGMKAIRLLNELDKLNKDESDLFTKLVSIGTGRTYTYDPRKARMANKGVVDKELEPLYSGYYRALKGGNTEEASRIRTMIMEKRKEY